MVSAPSSIPDECWDEAHMDFRVITECASLHTISRQHGPVSRPKTITRISDVSYCCSLRYRCRSHYELNKYINLKI